MAYSRMCAVLAPRTMALVVDDELVTMSFQTDNACITPLAAQPAVIVRTSRQTILDLIDDRLSLNGAILSGALDLLGNLNDLAIFHEGFLLYLQGAVRCPAFPALLDGFRNDPQTLAMQSQ